MKKIEFTPAQETEIVRLYVEEKMAPKTIGGKFYCHHSVIRKLLMKNGITLRDPSHSHQKYQIDELIFDVIDTADKAYWLGFLMGDCGVREEKGLKSNKGNHHSFYLSLGEEDGDYVFKFREFLKTDRPIKKCVDNRPEKGFRKDGSQIIMISLSIDNKHMVDSLAKYHIIPNKTENGLFPKNIPDKFMNSFLLGLIDSDGWFKGIENENGIRRGSIGFGGTYDIVKKFQKILMKKCKLEKTKIYPSDAEFFFTFGYGGEQQLLRIVKYLYTNPPSIFFDRKARKVFEILLEHYPNNQWLKEKLKLLGDKPAKFDIDKVFPNNSYKA